LWVRALGPLAAWVGGQPVNLGGRKQRTVLALLALRANARVSTDDLVDAVWGSGQSTERWQRNLQVYVANLRGLLHVPAAADDGHPTLAWDGHGYRLHMAADCCDIASFRQAVEQGRRLAADGEPAAAAERLRHAADLWAGKAVGELADCSLVTADLAELDEMRAGAVEDLMELQLALGWHAESLPELTGLAASYPLRERLRALQMIALYRCGHQPEALAAFRDLRHRLLEDFGVDPTPELRGLEEAILRQDPALDPPRHGRAPQARVFLPESPNELIGREADVARVCELMEDERHRLVTVHGPGGVGKTRLAVAAARRTARKWRDGAYWIDLAAVSSEEPMLMRIAQALALPAASMEGPATAVQAFLATRHVLLVLDNLEQLRGAAAAIADLVNAAPDLTVLATSRIVLRLSVEHAFLLEPLGVPTEDPLPQADLRHSPAVRLFEQRAKASYAGFVLTDAQLPSVVELCRRLDGLPLAIELAAARTVTLSPSALLLRLPHAHGILAGGPVDQPVRQRTLWLTLEWSHGLLEPVEQALFRRFAVFCDPATAEDVEQVCARPSREQASAFDAIEALVRHNLLTVRADPVTGSPRFSMLQTTREFALERLRRSKELEPTRRLHAAHITAVITAAVRDRAPAEWLSECRNHRDDVRAVLLWATEPDNDTTIGLRLAASLEQYWTTSGLVREGQQWCDRVLEATGPEAGPLLRAAVLNSAGTMAWLRGQTEQALELHTRALEIQLRAGDTAAVARSRFCIATQHYMKKQWGRGDALNRQAIAEAVSSDAGRVTVNAMVSLAVSALFQGRPEESRLLLLECLDRVRALGDDQLVCLVLLDLAGIAMDRGQYGDAMQYTLESLGISHALADVHHDAVALAQLSEVLIGIGDPVRAARWLGTISTFQAESGNMTLDADADHLSQLHSQTVQNGGVAAAAAFHEGRALTLSEAVAEAIVAVASRERLTSSN